MGRKYIAFHSGCSLVPRLVRATALHHGLIVVWFPDPSCMGGAREERSTLAPAPVQEGSGNQTSLIASSM